MADILGGKVGNSCSRNKNTIVLVVNVGGFLVNISCYELLCRRVKLQQIVVNVEDKDYFPCRRLGGSRVEMSV